MTPRTKKQKRLVEIYASLPKTTKKTFEYAQRHCFPNVAIESRNRMVCTKCGHSWVQEKGDSVNEITCPHCHKKLEKVEHGCRLYKYEDYFAESFACEGYQVFRYYAIFKRVTKSEMIYRHEEIGAIFMDENGVFETFSLLRNPYSYWSGFWNYNSCIELRKNSTILNQLVSAIKVFSIIPKLRRNGWDGRIASESPIDTPYYLLKNNRFETCWKTGQFGVCANFLNSRYNYKHYDLSKENLWYVVKLANRNGKKFSTKESWIDMLDYLADLKFLGKDITNPSVIFPENFQCEKMRINDKAAKIKERQETERVTRAKMNEVKRDAEKRKWVKSYEQKFSNMLIQNGDFTIKPLINMQDFTDEYKAMNHCIRTYYGKVNALLVDITHSGKKTETAEIDLVDYVIVQCRGANNQPSAYHDEIVRLLQESMKTIRKYNKGCKGDNVTKQINPKNLPACVYS